MAKIVLETLIAASPEACFDAARNIDLHCALTAGTKERAVDGVTTGLIGAGEWVTFEAVHFGVRQRLTSRIAEFERPHRFVDEMVKGAFKRLRHTHEFAAAEAGTRMTDTMEFEAPLGWLGLIAETLFLERYMRRFLERKNRQLKEWLEQKAPSDV